MGMIILIIVLLVFGAGAILPLFETDESLRPESRTPNRKEKKK
tara:strand:- start:427 stop:555 length:129 start_codon:yes stop_codon:yes gene_type:complete